MTKGIITSMGKKPEIIFLFPSNWNGDLDYHLGANYIIVYLRKQGICSIALKPFS